MALTLIVKATSDCNLGCLYCYMRGGCCKDKMPLSTLEKMTTQAFEANSQGTTHFIWHGGEPLLMGLDFYRKAVEFQRPFVQSGRRVKNGFQTNGTLVDDEVIEFARENHFNIGFSMDGDRETHNKTRFYACDGRGTFDDVLANIHKAKDADVGGGVVLVLTRNNIGNIKQLYEFFKKEGISVKMNPLIQSGRALEHLDELGITAVEYGRAIIELFDLWFNDPECNIRVDPVDNLIGNMLTGQPLGCTYGFCCQDKFVSVNYAGDVFPCGRFDGEEEYILGNIGNAPLKEILLGGLRQKLRQRNPNNLTKCTNCSFKGICNGGCMHNGIMIRGELMDPDFYCTGYKMIYSHIGKTLQEELAPAEVKNA